jgi:glycosyltransferase involved in cell wall biosynthesis
MTTETVPIASRVHTAAETKPELSIVMPCLNEAETLETCIRKAFGFLAANGVRGEVIIADNGSTDGSQALAERSGARVVRVEQKGYGNALQGGIAAARGEFIAMGDADDSYDFSSLMPFIEKLRDGYDLVMGNRFAGGVLPGAMPPLHRYLGNPILTGLGRLFFSSPVGDFHCGLRAFRKSAYERMQLRTTGMEFASEMVVKATLLGMRVTEVPTVLHPDGRSRAPHLRSWRDGWRHLRFLLLYSPRWLFLYPGILLMTVGLIGGALIVPRNAVFGHIGFDANSLLYSAAAVMIGYQAILFAFFTKVFAIGAGLLPVDDKLQRLANMTSLEFGVSIGVLLMAGGLGGSLWAVHIWNQADFGVLDPHKMLRLVIPSVTALILGCETVLSSFFLSVLSLARK